MIWLFKNRINVDVVASCWLITCFDSENHNLIKFIKEGENITSLGNCVFFTFDEAEWRQNKCNTLFEALLLRFNVNSPILQKMAFVIREADKRSDNPPPLSIALNIMLDGWKLSNSSTKTLYSDIVEKFNPVFDSLYSYYKNMLG